jgi:polyketide synthase PksN
MDSFAELQNLGGRRSLSINWTAWKETGMAVDYHINIDTLFKSIPTAKAVAAFEQVLNKEVSRIIIGEINYPIFTFFDRFSVRFGSVIEKRKNRFLRQQQSIEKKNLPEVRLKGKTSDSYNDVEVKISRIWASVLGLEEIDIYQHFFDLGGDSILATRLYKEIEREYPNLLDITDVFAYSTISQMSTYLENRLKREDENTGEAAITALTEATHDNKIVGGKDEIRFDDIMDILDRLEKGELSIEEADRTLFAGSK